MTETPHRPQTFSLARRLWQTDPTTLPPWKRAGLRTLKIAYAVGRDLLGGQLNLHAMSLVYTTLLSIIPLLAVSFTVFRAFKIDSGFDAVLANYLKPLGERGEVFARQIVDAVEGLDYTLLGSLGVLFLFYTVFTLITKIEAAFNYTWHIRHPRKLSQHFEYLAVILIGPLMILVVFGLTTAVVGTRVVGTLRQIEPVGAIFSLTGELLPYLLAIATFTFFYLFVPNTRVKLRAALLGALVAGLLWEATSRVFSSIVVASARYQALVSSFAIPLLFMIWLYLSWLILMIGAAVAFYYQNPEFLGISRERVRISNRLHEKLALLLVFLIGKRHYSKGEAWTAVALARRTKLPEDVVEGVLDSLESSGLIAATGRRETVYLPARPFEEVQLREVLDAIRTVEEGPYLNADRLRLEGDVDELTDRLTSAGDEVMGERTVKEWVTAPADGAPT